MRTPSSLQARSWPRSWARILGCASLMATPVALGRGVQQGPAEKLVDPRLRSEGVLVERQRGMRDLELGPYRVEGVTEAEVPFDGSGPLGPGESGRTRPTQQLRLSFSLVGGAAPWTADCVGQRRQPPDADLAAVADELRDEVAVHCQLTQQLDAGAGSEVGSEAEGQRWVLKVEGDLGDNLLGRLHPAGAPDEAKVVEIVMWYRMWNFTRRHLPASLALIRGQAGTEAALILDAPERAWLAPELDDAGRELDLVAMLALRLMPLGFES